MSRARLLWVLALLCAAPPAGAAPVEGVLVADGAVLFPSGASADALAAAALLDVADAETFAFRLETNLLRVHRYERTITEVVAPDGSRFQVSSGTTVHNYTLRDVLITATDGGDHLGWMGLYLPRPSPLTLASVDSLVVSAQARPVVATERSAADERTRIEPQMSSYEWEGVAPLLVGEGGGVVTWRGGGALKLMGPDLTFSSASNGTSYWTGNATTREGALRERLDRWFFLEFDDAEVEAGGRGAFRFAAAEMTTQWNGAVVLRPLEGALTAGGGTYQPTGRSERLVGDMRARLLPVVSAEGVRVQLHVSGDIVDASLPRTQTSRLAPGSAVGWLVPALLLGVAAVTAAALVVRHRRPRAAPPISADDHLALAHAAAEQQRFPDAVAHVREARAKAPRSVRLLLEEASFLGAMGRVEEALAHYARAAELDPEGDAEFQAAVLLLQSEGDAARAEALVRVALAKNPILVLEILYDVTGTFQPLRGRPEVEAALERARRALGDA